MIPEVLLEEGEQPLEVLQAQQVEHLTWHFVHLMANFHLVVRQALILK